MRGVLHASGSVGGFNFNKILAGLPKMKMSTPIASPLVALLIALTSTSVVADVDNCSSLFPKVPYNCELVRIEPVPLERADFSAFEIGSVKVATRKVQPILRSVTRDMARTLRSQEKTIVN